MINCEVKESIEVTANYPSSFSSRFERKKIDLRENEEHFKPCYFGKRSDDGCNIPHNDHSSTENTIQLAKRTHMETHLETQHDKITSMQLDLNVGEHYILNTCKYNTNDKLFPYPARLLLTNVFRNDSKLANIVFYIYEPHAKNFYRCILHPNVEIIVLNDDTDYSDKITVAESAPTLFSQNRRFVPFKFGFLFTNRLGIVRENIIGVSLLENSDKTRCKIERAEYLRVYIDDIERFERIENFDKIPELSFIHSLAESTRVNRKILVSHVEDFKLLIKWLREPELKSVSDAYKISIDFDTFGHDRRICSVENALMDHITF